jgi:hypothetical protein
MMLANDNHQFLHAAAKHASVSVKKNELQSLGKGKGTQLRSYDS